MATLRLVHATMVMRVYFVHCVQLSSAPVPGTIADPQKCTLGTTALACMVWLGREGERKGGTEVGREERGVEGREGGREGGREERRGEGWGGREGGREERRGVGREEGREGGEGREGRTEVGREGGRDGGREEGEGRGGREGRR